ncbi:MAG: C40 family peptidase [Deltaproteobacteria bacterium]|nr:C40 family peptidase [Deltaproteobacteria bacterium]
MLALALSLALLPPDNAERAVSEARKALGTPYVLGGRLRDAKDGLDCQGLVFFALQALSGCGWRSWSVMPTESVKGELGLPVAGAAPVAAARLAEQLPVLEPGDLLWFVDIPENPAEPSIATLDGARVWVWHVGLYAGDGRFVVGDHFAGQVVEEDLLSYTQQHYAGVFVTRMRDGPRPARCRAHRPMRVP